MAVQKYLLPSMPQFKILSLIHSSIDYKHQNIYRCERSFQKAMQQMINAHWIKKIKTNDFYDAYEITIDGKIVRSIINDFGRCNQKE